MSVYGITVRLGIAHGKNSPMASIYEGDFGTLNVSVDYCHPVRSFRTNDVFKPTLHRNRLAKTTPPNSNWN